MKTTLEKRDGKMVATLIGELDTAAAIDVEKALQPLYESKGVDVVIDCEKLEYIASSGLRILLSILKKTKAGGSKVTLLNVNDEVRTVFELTGLISLFDFA
jgi:anti-anti-sigma factor